MLFASDLCFICKYFQSQCNFVQLLQVFINNLMRLFQRTDRGIVNYGLSHGDDDGDDDVGDDGSQCLSSTTALFWATVSFCCQSLIAKEHINFSSRTGEDFTFLFICSQGFSLPFFLKCFTLWVKFNKKNPPKKQQQKNTHVKQLQLCLLYHGNIENVLDGFFFQTYLSLHASIQTTWTIIKDKFPRGKPKLILLTKISLKNNTFMYPRLKPVATDQTTENSNLIILFCKDKCCSFTFCIPRS